MLFLMHLLVDDIPFLSNLSLVLFVQVFVKMRPTIFPPICLFLMCSLPLDLIPL